MLSAESFALDAYRRDPAHEVYAMTKLASFPLAAGVFCLIGATILIVKIGGPLDAQILDHYFVLSPKWLFITGTILIISSLALLAVAHRTARSVP